MKSKRPQLNPSEEFAHPFHCRVRKFPEAATNPMPVPSSAERRMDGEGYKHTHSRAGPIALVALLAALCICPTTQAQHRHEHAIAGRPAWHGDIRRFHEHDWGLWRGGHWVHGPHGGRLAWWWVVGSSWYFYPTPVYPYPNPYEPPATMEAPPSAPLPQYWYFCEGAQGYYPYVPACPGGWKQVPAKPSDAAPP